MTEENRWYDSLPASMVALGVCAYLAFSGFGNLVSGCKSQKKIIEYNMNNNAYTEATSRNALVRDRLKSSSVPISGEDLGQILINLSEGPSKTP